MKFSDTFEFITIFLNLINFIPFEHKCQQSRQNPNPIQTFKKNHINSYDLRKIGSFTRCRT